MEKRDVVAAGVIVVVLAVVAVTWQEEGVEAEISTQWENETTPFYEPSIVEGEPATLWFRAHNTDDQRHFFEARITSGPYINVSHTERTVGNMSANSDGGLLQLRVQGNLPAGRESYTSNLTITLVTGDQEVASTTETVEIVAAR